MSEKAARPTKKLGRRRSSLLPTLRVGSGTIVGSLNISFIRNQKLSLAYPSRAIGVGAHPKTAPIPRSLEVIGNLTGIHPDKWVNCARLVDLVGGGAIGQGASLG